MIHYTHPYLLSPVHKITVDLVGLGGTGSKMLSNLARTNEALLALGHPGLMVRAWDPDTVTEANKGRQLFSASDIGLNKAMVLVTRVNRYFGYDWQAIALKYDYKKTSNILITCVDNAAARINIAQHIKANSKEPYDELYYWLDLGNLRKTGQCVLGTMRTILQPKKPGQTRAVLPHVVKKFPLKKVKEEEQGPSCSLAEALMQQDLFINSTLAELVVTCFGNCCGRVNCVFMAAM